jgi:hypothetical protein
MDLLPDFNDIDQYIDREAYLERSIYIENQIGKMRNSTKGDSNPCRTINLYNDVSAENNSSVILEITIDEKKFLFYRRCRNWGFSQSRSI